MKIMCDTNVIIDVLLEREPFAEDSCQVLRFCEEHKIDGFKSPIPTIQQIALGRHSFIRIIEVP